MKITERGQITIPKPLRKKYGITPATELELLESNGGLLLLKARGISPMEKFRGLARHSKGIPRNTDDFLRAIREGD